MYDTNLSAMNAFADGVAYTAHNVANINTDGYQSQNFAYGAGPVGTVEVQPSLPADTSAIGQATSQTAGTAQSGNDSARIFAPGADITGDMSGLTQPVYNNVSLERQMVNLIAAQYGFEANAVTISTRAHTEQDALIGLVANYRA